MAFLSAMNPLLLWGSLAVAAPIIIHLLSKRRFQEVRWAAMDFLLQADQENRRRIRLEHLLLLLLRCLLILLIAALLARPILDFSSLGAGGIQLGTRDNLVLLDDSPSMGAKKDNESLFNAARTELIDTVRALADQRPQDNLTLYLVSSPDRPVLRSVPLSNADSIVTKIQDLPVSDVVGDMDEAVRSIQEEISKKKGDANKSVLILSDFRAHNWETSGEDSAEEGKGSLQSIRDFAEKFPQTPWQLAVISRGIKRNLSVTRVSAPRRAIAAKVPTTFEVTVQNQGLLPSATGQVTFSVMDTRPLTAEIGQLAPGASKTVPFTYTVRDKGPVKIEASIEGDRLAADDLRFFAANVTDGTRVLLIDGEQAPKTYNSETFYLKHALSPRGPRRTGYQVETISEKQLLERSLDQYGVVIIANVFHLSIKQAQELENYVANGGGVAIFLGDQVQASSYNTIHKSYPSLFPVKLEKVTGDPNMQQSWQLSLEHSNHPVLRIFAGDNNPLLSTLKLFRWWQTKLPEKEEKPQSTNVLAYVDAVNKDPAIIESRIGDGRVLVFTMPADAEWSNWVTTPSYPVAMLETAAHLVKTVGPVRQIQTGSPLRESIDPSKFSLEADLVGPSGQSLDTLRAQPDQKSEDTVFIFNDTRTKGFYKLIRQRRDGPPAPVLFAANISGAEGKLKRVSESSFADVSDVSNITVTRSKVAESLNLAGNRVELWRPLLLIFALVLGLEQLAGWYFGRRRSFRT